MTHYRRLIAIVLAALFCSTSDVVLISSPTSRKQQMVTKGDYMKLAEEMEATLERDVLGVWFPRSVDKKNGGFLSDFTRDWKLGQPNEKFSVFQGRMVWVAAQVTKRRPNLKTQFQPIVEHGFNYLNDVLWDQADGGFFWGLDENNRVSQRYTDGKHLYGMSFGLYGATAAYEATHDKRALALGQRAFEWMDQHAHDQRHGGYFEWLSRKGAVVQRQDIQTSEVPVAGFPVGFKSMNTHIHLLESFTQLYEIWPNELLRRRLEELLSIVRDKICVEPGVMNLYFTPDWRPIPDHDSYGHDVETAYLILEAETVLDRSTTKKTEVMARALVDHALSFGWDKKHGGFYRDGTTFGVAEDKRKEWWVQFEGLNALLLMHEKYGRVDGKYYEAFEQQWSFIKEHQVDKEFGGFFDTVEENGSVTDYTKSRIWKECYHETRALLNTIERLKRLTQAK